MPLASSTAIPTEPVVESRLVGCSIEHGEIQPHDFGPVTDGSGERRLQFHPLHHPDGDGGDRERVPEVGIAQVSIGEVGTKQYGVAQISVGQVRASKILIAQLGELQQTAAPVHAGEGASEQAAAGTGTVTMAPTATVADARSR